MTSGKAVCAALCESTVHGALRAYACSAHSVRPTKLRVMLAALLLVSVPAHLCAVQPVTIC